ncbi:pro-adrenomedullin-like [Hyla sarda]|uniref:pro-adrenomedullin-like n=1 Tax=Hyla sarda TaxID=327740 RepID=UPI0024C2AE40|nr:pro-adrenomedullin-like [Hyla sarda]
MAFRGCLVLIFLVMTINVCSAHWMGSRDRRMPPPVESFLEKLRGLTNQRLKRDVRDSETHISTQEVPKEDAQTSQNALSSLLHLREKRYAATAGGRGCHLGTCQIQNLANMLYRLGNNNYKDGSNRDTKDPLGYGRRRRSLLREKERTGLSETLLAT